MGPICKFSMMVLIIACALFVMMVCFIVVDLVFGWVKKLIKRICNK